MSQRKSIVIKSAKCSKISKNEKHLVSFLNYLCFTTCRHHESEDYMRTDGSITDVRLVSQCGVEKFGCRIIILLEKSRLKTK